MVQEPYAAEEVIIVLEEQLNVQDQRAITAGFNALTIMEMMAQGREELLYRQAPGMQLFDVSDKIEFAKAMMNIAQGAQKMLAPARTTIREMRRRYGRLADERALQQPEGDADTRQLNIAYVKTATVPSDLR